VPHFLQPRRALALVLLGGCGDYREDVACLASVEPAIVLEIRDSSSGAGRAIPAVATVSDGGFSDTLRLLPPESGDSAYRQGPNERGGTYDLSVVTPGYVTWSRNDIVVDENVCHVETVRLTAHLTPE
jgi:hypothetical protein